eukprot:1104773-Pelagomonas_calceolata.AAC.3
MTAVTRAHASESYNTAANNAMQKGCPWLWCSVGFILAGRCAQGVRTRVLQQETKSGLWCGTVLIPVGLMRFPGWWTIG